MAAKFLTFTCIRSNKESSTTLSSSPRPHYPSMPKYPNGALLPPEDGTAIEGSSSKALFSVVGTTRSARAGSVEKAIKRLPGIREAIVDVPDEETIRETIEDAGFVASVIKDEEILHSDRIKRHAAWFSQIRRLITSGTNAALLLFSLLSVRSRYFSKFQGLVFLQTSSMLISFILLVEVPRDFAKGKTSEAIAKLMDLAPETATLLVYNDEGIVVSEQKLISRSIRKNDVLKVVSRAKVACDGFVILGQSHVNESMITLRVETGAKREGDMVIGAQLNENWVLHIKATTNRS
ncbi:hypothetical protein Dimus_036626 [Dionaea muscipula]